MELPREIAKYNFGKITDSNFGSVITPPERLTMKSEPGELSSENRDGQKSSGESNKIFNLLAKTGVDPLSDSCISAEALIV